MKDKEILDARIKYYMGELSENEVKRISHLMRDILILYDLGIVFLGPDALELLRAMRPRVHKYHDAILKGRKF